MATLPKYSIPCGIGLIAAGLCLHYLIGRRRFGLRNVAGLQQFPSYGRALWVGFWERVVLLAAKLIIAADSILLAAAGFTHFKI